MPGQPVIAGEAFAAGLRTEFLTTYRRRIETVNSRLSRAMQVGIPSDKDTENYFYWESAPHVKRWIRGENLPRKGFKGVKYPVSNFEWAHGIEWHFADRADDLTKSLVNHARGLGQSFAVLDERIFFQLVLNSTDLDLLGSVPNAPDGAAFFATTAGGAARFGVTNGNLLTGGGVASVEAIRADFFKALSQFRLMQDTEGQPLWDETTLDGVILVIYGAANERVFREAFLQTRHIQSDGATGTAAVSNVIQETQRVALWSTQRIASGNNDWYVVLADSDLKPTFSQEREGMREALATWDNSDTTRQTGIESLSWVARRGYGINVPFAGVQINN